MKGKLVTVALALILALPGMGLGAGLGRVLPAVGTFLGGNPEGVSASGLTTVAAAPPASQPAGSGFTYQGKLLDNGQPVDGQYDFTFKLFDLATGGTQIGATNPVNGQPVTGGLFTVPLDFGSSAFNGDARWLETAVRPTGGGNLTTLSPRQPITPAPYALYAFNTRHPKNLVTVSPSGGDFTSIQAALASITDASASNRYLVKVGPGLYTERVTMKPYVDIEGSGEDNTKITFTGDQLGITATVVGASNAELRYLTVENTGGNNRAVAIRIYGSSPSLVHLTVVASGASDVNFGIMAWNSNSSVTDTKVTASGGAILNWGISSSGSVLTLANVTVTVSGAERGAAVISSGGSLEVRNSKLVASGQGNSIYAVWNSGGSSVRIDDSTLTSTSGTIVNETGSTTRVGASKLDGGPVDGNGSGVRCAGVYDENYTFYANNCP